MTGEIPRGEMRTVFMFVFNYGVFRWLTQLSLTS